MFMLFTFDQFVEVHFGVGDGEIRPPKDTITRSGVRKNFTRRRIHTHFGLVILENSKIACGVRTNSRHRGRVEFFPRFLSNFSKSSIYQSEDTVELKFNSDK